MLLNSALAMTFTQSANAQLVNGDFEDRTPLPASAGNCITGDAAARFVPDPWTRIGTPDYSNEAEVSFTTDIHPRTSLSGFDVSPSGGCFQGFRNVEGISQTITIADASAPIKWSYFYTQYTRPGRNQCTPTIEFRVNATNSTSGTAVGTAPTIGTPGGPTSEGNWISGETNAFIPANFGVVDGGTMPVYFGSANSACTNTWGFIDSVEIVPDVIIEALNDDFGGTPINLSTGGTTASIFSNDTLDNTAFSNIDVTVALLDDGQVTGATINPDGTIDVPAGTPAGTYQVEYEICEAGNPGNCDTAFATITVANLTPLPPVLPPIVPGVCHAVIGEAYLLDGLGIGGEQNYQLASGSATHDPDVFFGTTGAEVGYVKNADGSVTYYFDGEAPAQTNSSTVNSIGLRNISAVAGSAADQTDAAEFWRAVARFDGVPGESYNFDLNNGNAHEFIHYWAEDSSGYVLDSSLGKPNTANGWTYGTGSTASTSGPNPIAAQGTTPISYTIPASSTDGIVYVNILVLDPQVGWGRLGFSGAPECPDPSLAITKVADDATDRKPGDTITYTYTVENTGNIDTNDITVTDVHNGSGAISAITIDALTNTSGNSSDDGADNIVDVLAPDDSVTFVATYVVTEADVISGGDITNTATVTGEPVIGSLPSTPITADEAVTVAPLDVDLSLTKTNTTGVNGEVDQAADTLTSGDTTTYTVTVTNNGPDTITGAVVTDTVVEGLTCSATDSVTISGDGVPAGSFTIGDLTGAGITLETLADGEVTNLSYTCDVN